MGTYQPILACDVISGVGRVRTAPAGAEAAVAKKRGDGDKQVSNKKLRALGWRPRYPNFGAAMTESILPSFELEA